MDLRDAFAGFLVICGLGLFFAGVLCIFALLGTAFGAFIGWIVSLTPLGSLVEQGFQVFHFDATGLLPHIGATLGFVTGFIKGLIQVKTEKED